MINADNVQISTVLDAQQTLTNTTMLVETSCTHDGLMGWGILALGLCNPQSNLVVTGTIAGKSADYIRPVPAQAQVSSFVVGGLVETTVSVQVTFQPQLKASEHLAHLVIIDTDEVKALNIDYVDSTKVQQDKDGNIIGVELTLPTFTKLPATARAVLVVDLDIVASGSLQHRELANSVAVLV